MTDANFPLTADSDFDDLPRTLRREKEARAREAREARERRERERRSMDGSLGDPPSYLARRAAPVAYGDEPAPAVVQRFDVPFLHLVKVFLKATLAAVPALILLGVMLYYAGKGLDAYAPELLRMKIMVTVPGGV